MLRPTWALVSGAATVALFTGLGLGHVQPQDHHLRVIPMVITGWSPAGTIDGHESCEELVGADTTIYRCADGEMFTS